MYETMASKNLIRNQSSNSNGLIKLQKHDFVNVESVFEVNFF